MGEFGELGIESLILFSFVTSIVLAMVLRRVFPRVYTPRVIRKSLLMMFIILTIMYFQTP